MPVPTCLFCFHKFCRRLGHSHPSKLAKRVRESMHINPNQKGVWEYERVRPSKWCRSTSSSRKKLDYRGCSVSSLPVGRTQHLQLKWGSKSSNSNSEVNFSHRSKILHFCFCSLTFFNQFHPLAKSGINTLTCDSTEYSPARKDESKMKGDQRSWVKLLMRLGGGSTRGGEGIWPPLQICVSFDANLIGAFALDLSHL